MKKLLILTNVLWLSLFVFTSFKPLDRIAAFAAAPSFAYHLIDASLVKLMSENYREFYVKTFIKKKPNALDNSNGILNTIDSRTIWFSKEKLLGFINDMDAKAALHGGTVSGIRFYYIKYPDADIWSKYQYFTDPDMHLPASYQNRHSLMLVPTYYDAETKFHTDFDPRKFDAATNKFVDLPTVLEQLIKNETNPITATTINDYNVFKKGKREIPALPVPPNSQKLTIINTNTPGINPISDYKAAMVMSDNSGYNAAAANGGGLIPPLGGGGEALKVQNADGTAATMQQSNTVNIPCSGAKLMLYVDGYMKCGLQPIVDQTKNGN